MRLASRAAASVASRHAILRTGGDDGEDRFDSPLQFRGGKLKYCKGEIRIATWNVERLTESKVMELQWHIQQLQRRAAQKNDAERCPGVTGAAGRLRIDHARPARAVEQQAWREQAELPGSSRCKAVPRAYASRGVRSARTNACRWRSRVARLARLAHPRHLAIPALSPSGVACASSNSC